MSGSDPERRTKPQDAVPSSEVQDAGGRLPPTEAGEGRLASPLEIFLLVLFLGLAFVMLAASLIALWPQPAVTLNPEGIPIPQRTPEGQPVWQSEIGFFGVPLGNVGSEIRLFALVVIAGFLGSFIHVAVSVADYVGNRRLVSSWIYWYLLRLPVGSALAVLFYLLVRGGILTGSTSGTDLQPYGIAGISALAGLFSKQATDKLREVFETLFRTGTGDQERADKLATGPPVLEAVSPDVLGKGADSATLVLHGRNFPTGSRVRIGGRIRQANFRSGSELEVSLDGDDLSEARELTVQVLSPGHDGGSSETMKIRVQ